MAQNLTDLTDKEKEILLKVLDAYKKINKYSGYGKIYATVRPGEILVESQPSEKH